MQSATSFLAYIENLEKLTGDKLTIMKTIKKEGEVNNMMLHELTGLNINNVSGRVNDLHKLGLIINSKKDTCPTTGSLTKFWRMKRRIN